MLALLVALALVPGGGDTLRIRALTGSAPSFESRPRDMSIEVPEFVPGR